MRKLNTLPAALILAFITPIMLACKGELPRASETSIDTAAFDTLFYITDSLQGGDLHSLMVVHKGKIVYEKYAEGHSPDELHVFWSGSKTVTATAVGFAVEEGLLTLDDKIVQYFTPEELPDTISERLNNLTIRHLLTMSGGFEKDWFGRACSGENFQWAKEQLAVNITSDPGTKWEYNSMETYLLSVIISRVSGEKLEDYLESRLFDPLGIKEHYWDESPQGYSAGGWGLHARLVDYAALGQLFLQKGKWKGRRLINSEWIEQGMTPQIYQKQDKQNTDDWDSGYGYQMWCNHGSGARFEGAYGQICMIFPDKELVVAMFANSENYGGQVISVWEHIYPKFK